MLLNAGKVQELTQGKLIAGSKDFIFSQIFYDVIKDTEPRGDFLYIPYINSYRQIDSTGAIESMAEKGGKGLLLTPDLLNKVNYSNYHVVIIVDDLENSVLKLAKYLRVKNNNTIFAVTGSSGKTTSKELISEILRENQTPHGKTLRNINGYGGASHTIFNLNKNEAGVLEVGVNGLKRLSLLAETVSPNYLLVTNIYHTHFDKIPNLKDVASYKLSLTNYMDKNGIKVIFGDCTYLKKYMDSNTVTFGLGNDNDYTIKEIIYSDIRGSEFIISAKGNELKLFTPLLGKHNIVNVLGVTAICMEAGIKGEVIARAVKNFKGIKDDFYATMGIYKAKGWEFFDDSQHFNLPALKVGLDTYLNITNGHGGVVLLSYDYKFESPNFNFNEILEILVNSRAINILILVGLGWRKWQHELERVFAKEIIFLNDKREAAKYIKINMQSEKSIYLKGDFHDHLRGIINMLEEDNFELK